MKNLFYKNPLFQIHIAVFLWGFTAILGKLISIQTTGLVWLRMSIAALVFLAIKDMRISIPILTKIQWIKLIGIGIIICLHWLCFYQSIKEYNSSSLALICLGTGAMFVVWIEYFARIHPKLNAQNLLISIIAAIGMYFVSQGNKRDVFSPSELGSFEWAIIYGILASLLAAIFTILNAKMTEEVKPSVISFVEMLAGSIFLLILHLFWLDFDFVWTMSSYDVLYLILLSVFCTNVPFLLSIYSLKKLDPFIVTLTVNLEPIYGLVLSALIFHEHRNFNQNFFIGTFLILISVFLPLFFKKWINRVK